MSDDMCTSRGWYTWPCTQWAFIIVWMLTAILTFYYLKVYVKQSSSPRSILPLYDRVLRKQSYLLFFSGLLFLIDKITLNKLPSLPYWLQIWKSLDMSNYVFISTVEQGIVIYLPLLWFTQKSVGKAAITRVIRIFCAYWAIVLFVTVIDCYKNERFWTYREGEIRILCLDIFIYLNLKGYPRFQLRRSVQSMIVQVTLFAVWRTVDNILTAIWCTNYSSNSCEEYNSDILTKGATLRSVRYILYLLSHPLLTWLLIKHVKDDTQYWRGLALSENLDSIPANTSCADKLRSLFKSSSSMHAQQRLSDALMIRDEDAEVLQSLMEKGNKRGRRLVDIENLVFLEPVGVGATGKVFRGHYNPPGNAPSLVAIKVLEPFEITAFEIDRSVCLSCLSVGLSLTRSFIVQLLSRDGARLVALARQHHQVLRAVGIPATTRPRVRVL
jgi:hypothetical protein